MANIDPPRLFDCVINPEGSPFTNFHNRYCALYNSRYWTVVKPAPGSNVGDLIQVKQDLNPSTALLFTILKIVSLVTIVIPIGIFLIHALDYRSKAHRYIVNDKSEMSVNHPLNKTVDLFEGLKIEADTKTKVFRTSINKWLKSGTLELKHLCGYVPEATIETLSSRIKDRIKDLDKYEDFSRKYERLSALEQNLLTVRDFEETWDVSAIKIGIMNQQQLMKLTMKEVQAFSPSQKEYLTARLHLIEREFYSNSIYSETKPPRRQSPNPVTPNLVPQNVESVTLGQVAQLEPAYLNTVLKHIPAPVMTFVTSKQLVKLKVEELTKEQFSSLSRGEPDKMDFLSEEQVRAATPLFDSLSIYKVDFEKLKCLDFSKMSREQFLEVFPPHMDHDKKGKECWSRGEDKHTSHFYRTVGHLNEVPAASYFDKMDDKQVWDLSEAQLKASWDQFSPSQILKIPSHKVKLIDPTKLQPETRTRLLNQAAYVTPRLELEQVRICLKNGWLDQSNIKNINYDVLKQLDLIAYPDLYNIVYLTTFGIGDVPPEKINEWLEQQKPAIPLDLIKLLKLSQRQKLRTDLLSPEQVSALFTPMYDRGSVYAEQYARERAAEFSDAQLSSMLKHISVEHFRAIDPARRAALDYSKVPQDRLAELQRVT